MPPLQAAEDHRRSLAKITTATMMGARRIWSKLGIGDFDEAWAALSPDVVTLLMAGQLAAAREAQAYVPAVLADQSLPDSSAAAVNPRSVVGVSGSGMPLGALMQAPLIRVRTHLAAGAPMTIAQGEGGKLLDGIVKTQIADADRAIESVELAVRPQITIYVRMLQLPSCARCVILAGRHYRWSAGFDRHLRCDCVHIPTSEDVAGDLTTDPRKAFESGQVHGLTKTETKAINDGADMAKVVNSRRGMSTGQVFGQKVKTTTAGVRKGQAPRLRPESVYKLAGNNRDEALRLLQVHGYIR